MKKYRLKKDLPDAKAGSIYVKEGDRYVREKNQSRPNPVIEVNSYFDWQVEKSPEWFEEVAEKEYTLEDLKDAFNAGRLSWSPNTFIAKYPTFEDYLNSKK